MAKTSNLELPGYKVIEPNCIYARAVQQGSPDAGFVPEGILEMGIRVKELISLVTLTSPSHDAVVDYIRMQASLELDGSKPFYELLKKLPKEHLEKIVNEDKETLDKLKQVYETTKDYDAGSRNLSILVGVTPEIVFQMVSGALEDSDPVTKINAFNGHTENTYKIQIRLNDDYLLPDQLRIEHLLEEQVSRCKLFAIKHKGDYKKAAEKFRFLYNSLQASGGPGVLNDESESLLATEARYVVKIYGESLEDPTKDLLKILGCKAGLLIGPLPPELIKKIEQLRQQRKKQNPKSSQGNINLNDPFSRN